MMLIIGVILAALACNSDTTIEPRPGLNIVYYDFDADWSPDGSKIVFIKLQDIKLGRDGGLFFVNLEDSSLSPLLIQPYSIEDSPRFSPDGEWVVFSMMRDIYKIKANGDSLQQLTFTSDNYQPDWSPDGKKIAYNHGIGDDRGIHILDLESGESRLIVPYSERPVWFSDGTRLAIASYNFGNDFPEIAIIDTNGNIIGRPIAERHGIVRNLDVSANGEKICFSQQFSGEHPQLWIMNTDGGDLKKMTSRGGFMPTFSHDGEWIVFTRTDNNDGSLWLIRPDGSEKRRLTDWWNTE